MSLSEEEAEWLKNLLIEIPMWSKLVPTILNNGDCISVIDKVPSNTYNGKFRYIHLRHI